MPAPILNAHDIVAYVRYEPRIRVQDFSTTVKAKVHDALWMLTQQWRVGEFKGDDAGSLMKAKIETQSTFLNRFKSRNGPVEPFDRKVPLEALVERQPVAVDLGMGLEIGLQWKKILVENDISHTYVHFLAEFPIETEFSEPEKASNTAAMQIRRTVTGRLIDGAAFYAFLSDHHAKDVAGIDPVDYDDIDIAELQFRRWFSNTYYTPDAQADSWSDAQLEYQFSLSLPLNTTPAAMQTVFNADRYDSGNLEWYSVDINGNPTVKLVEDPGSPIGNNVIEPAAFTSYIPQPVSFKGMPNERWWEFEDRNIDISRMLAQKQDLTRLVVLEFGLIYSNDWFAFPHIVKTGTVTAINRLVVTDVFGRQILIERAGTGQNNDWQRWDMYNISKDTNNAVESYNKLLLLPALGNRMESDPLEKVLFLRDEMANMVWGVEEIVPDELMGGMNGRDAFNSLLRYLLADYEPEIPQDYEPNNARLRYKLTNSVPENWIPFIPVKTNAPQRSIKLQRAALLRYLEDQATNDKIRPRTGILSPGLNLDPPAAYYINEEEVSRSGFSVISRFERTRWLNGKTFTWMGRKVHSGRGEVNSGLLYDLLKDKEPDEQS